MSDLDSDDICMWCAKPYSKHDDSRSDSDPVPKVPCLLFKQHFFTITREIVIRTDENDPKCLRVAVPVYNEKEFSRRLTAAILGYRRDIGDWPSLEQVCNAIYRYTKDR